MFKYKKPEKTGGLFKGMRLTMAITAFIAGASFCFAGDEWHSSPTFYYINQLPIPWMLYGVLLLIGGACIATTKVRPIGFLIGAILYTFFAITVWLAVIGGFHLHVFFLNYLNFPASSVGSFYAACNATTICVLYWSALKAAVYVHVDPERSVSANHV